MAIGILAFPFCAMANWSEYAVQPNGDVYFFDSSRVERQGDVVTVWTRVRYKTSVMAASSYQSRVRINCVDKSEAIVQSTFFSDREWEKPAMATNKKEKPAVPVQDKSPSSRLMNLVCGF